MSHHELVGAVQGIVPVTAIGVEGDGAEVFFVGLVDGNRVGLRTNLIPSTKQACVSPLMIDGDSASTVTCDISAGVARVAEGYGIAGRSGPIMGVSLGSPPSRRSRAIRRETDGFANRHLLLPADAQGRNPVASSGHRVGYFIGELFLGRGLLFGGLFAFGGFLGVGLGGILLGAFFSCPLGTFFGCGLFLGRLFVLHDLGGHVNFKPVSHVGRVHHVGVVGLFDQLDLGAVALRLDRIKRVAVCCDGLELELLLGVNLDACFVAGDLLVVIALDHERRVVQLQLDGGVSGRGLGGLVLVLLLRGGRGCLAIARYRGPSLFVVGGCVVLGFLRSGLGLGGGLGAGGLLDCRLGCGFLRGGLGGFAHLLHRISRRHVSGLSARTAVVNRLLIWSCGIFLLPGGECGYVDQRRSQEDGHEHRQGFADERILKFD